MHGRTMTAIPAKSNVNQLYIAGASTTCNEVRAKLRWNGSSGVAHQVVRLHGEACRAWEWNMLEVSLHEWVRWWAQIELCASAPSGLRAVGEHLAEQKRAVS
jgi:hypothetical protein